MRRAVSLLYLIIIAAAATGCAGGADAFDSPLAAKMQEEVARDAPVELAPGSELLALRARHFIFVGGFLNEAIPGYWKDQIEVAAREVGAEASSLFPSSREGVADDAELIAQTARLRWAESGKPVVLVGHSKGGAGSLLAVLRHPELVLEGKVDRVVAIQGAIGGSPIADSILGSGPIRVLPVRFRGLESLSTERARKLFDRELDRLRARLSEDELARISSRIFYVRARAPSLGDVVLELKVTHEFLAGRGSGQSDGLLLVEDMKRDDFGVDLGVIRGDHAALTVAGILSNTSSKERRAFTRALLREVFGPR